MVGIIHFLLSPVEEKFKDGKWAAYVYLHGIPVNQWRTEDLTVKPGFHLSVSADEGTLIQSCAA